ncbi:MAG: SDR family NAD(P)-dependent oxidoreductase [Bacteroidetes bacterium]|nr:SDR family NAD(P)-dependent oxidoreductase [Bacteroidota bacterium]MBU1115250.1 SDR family NAD(P)-dependent oxidoreductase [Bacteroidota bacterium]MBU1797268.1 SDR family NAD(P)-dependent oxidoreductase [Bacteroidota bacterium]
MTFENKTVLITGASSGIGKALGEKLLNVNCNIILTARGSEKIEDWVNKYQNRAATILILKNDVSDKNSVVETYNKSIEKFGNIDVAILNSGIGKSVTPQTFNSQIAEDIINTNFLGVVYWIEQLLPNMMKNKSGIIAPVSSLADNRGYSGSGFYCASKAALSIFAEGLSLDLAKFGIKVITIKPGFVKTKMTDQNKFKMPFMISAEKAAEKIIAGIKKEKNIIQFPLPTVLGAKFIGMLPNWIYRLIAKYN